MDVSTEQKGGAVYAGLVSMVITFTIWFCRSGGNCRILVITIAISYRIIVLLITLKVRELAESIYLLTNSYKL